jgi:hypothetical protein
MTSHTRTVARRRLSIESLESRRLLARLYDLDGDGDLDAVTATAWYENADHQGNLLVHPLPEGTPSQFAVADLDGDRDPDIVTSGGTWYENGDGRGDFSSHHQWNPGFAGASRLSLYDSDRDGDIDIVVLLDTAQAYLYENIDQGRSFTAHLMTADDSFAWLAAADVDADGDLDSLTITRHDSEPACATSCDTVSLQRNRGDGSYSASQLPQPIDSQPVRTIEIVDIDGDGQVDIVVERADAWHWYPNHQGEFETFVYGSPVGDGLQFFSDIDRDGDLDAVFHSGDRTLGWSLTRGIPGPHEPPHWQTVDLPAPEPPEVDIRAMNVTDVGDLNGDGIVDFVTALTADGRPIWLDGAMHKVHQYVEPREAGDVNYDRIFDSNDLVIVSAAGEYEDGIAHNSTFEEGDWNGDGDFGTGDLVLALQLGTYRSSSYPRLVFGAEDIPTIRKTLARDKYAQKFAGERAFALSLLNTDFSDPSLYESQKSSASVRVAFVVLMLGKDDPDRNRIAAKAREILLHINDGLWHATDVVPTHHAGWDGTELHPYYAGSAMMNYSIAYDWLVGADQLSGIDRAEVRFRILRLAQIEHDIHSTPVAELDRDNYYLRNANKRFRSLGGVGMVALAFPEQTGLIDDPHDRLRPEDRVPFDTQQVLDFVMRELFEQITIESSRNPVHEGMIEHYVSPDGFYEEGFTYQNDVFSVMTPFLVCYDRLLGIDYISGKGPFDDRIARMYTNDIRVILPDKTRPNIGDSWAGSWYAYPELIADYSPAPELNHWLFEEVNRSSMGNVGLTVLNLRPDDIPLPEPAFRTEFIPEAGMAVFRDRWGPDATYLMLLASHRPVRGHNQADQGSIMLYANGAHLVLDPGYGTAYGRMPEAPGYVPGGNWNWLNSALGHSGITVDSIYRVDNTPAQELRSVVHPRATLTSYTDAPDPGYLRNTLAARDIDYAEAHITYEAKEATLVRAVAFPRHRYFILDDNLRAQEPHDYGWQLHLGDTSTGSFSADGSDYLWVTPNKDGEHVGLGISMLDERRHVEVYGNGPTNLVSEAYPDHVFEHTYILAQEHAVDTRYITLLDPHALGEAPLQTETLVPGSVWKVVHSPEAYDVIISQSARSLLAVDQIVTDATFAVISIDIVGGRETVRSVLTKGGTSITVLYDKLRSFLTAPDEVFHYEA